MFPWSHAHLNYIPCPPHPQPHLQPGRCSVPSFLICEMKGSNLIVSQILYSSEKLHCSKWSGMQTLFLNEPKKRPGKHYSEMSLPGIKKDAEGFHLGIIGWSNMVLLLQSLVSFLLVKEEIWHLRIAGDLMGFPYEHHQVNPVTIWQENKSTIFKSTGKGQSSKIDDLSCGQKCTKLTEETNRIRLDKADAALQPLCLEALSELVCHGSWFRI